MRRLLSTITTAIPFIFLLVRPSMSHSVSPGSTVNNATGEMQLSIPLGNVQGLGGNDFPLNVGYSGGGIQTFQEASPVGLGFSYGPGGITRKIVFVADENQGGSGNYSQDFSEFSDIPCDRPWWLELRAALFGAGFFGLLLMPPTNEFFSCKGASYLGQKAYRGFSQDIRNINFDPRSYISGDASNVAYNRLGNGRGFLRGGTDDIPDIYFVNTPYVSGILMWDLAGRNIGDGHFVFKQSGGSEDGRAFYAMLR